MRCSSSGTPGTEELISSFVSTVVAASNWSVQKFSRIRSGPITGDLSKRVNPICMAEQDDDLDDLNLVEFEPGEEPTVLTTPNLCALFGGCERCPGFASVAATGLLPNHPHPDELVCCTHECHRVAAAHQPR